MAFSMLGHLLRIRSSMDPCRRVCVMQEEKKSNTIVILHTRIAQIRYLSPVTNHRGWVNDGSK